jgi:hypothetical protein
VKKGINQFLSPSSDASTQEEGAAEGKKTNNASERKLKKESTLCHAKTIIVRCYFPADSLASEKTHLIMQAPM